MTLAFHTSLGRFEIIYGPEGVHSVQRSEGRRPPRGAHPPTMRRLAASIAGAIDGKKASFTKVRLVTTGVPPFHIAVYRALMATPWGVTLSYGELAARAGRPGAARAVGRAMACNRWSILVPCHRVIQSNGRLGGYGPGGLDLKRRLLDAEAGFAVEDLRATARPRRRTAPRSSNR